MPCLLHIGWTAVAAEMPSLARCYDEQEEVAAAHHPQLSLAWKHRRDAAGFHKLLNLPGRMLVGGRHIPQALQRTHCALGEPAGQAVARIHRLFYGCRKRGCQNGRDASAASEVESRAGDYVVRLVRTECEKGVEEAHYHVDCDLEYLRVS